MTSDASRQLSRREVADRAGLRAQSIDTYRRRGVFPEPDGHVGRSPWWYLRTIDKWERTRRQRGEKIKP